MSLAIRGRKLFKHNHKNKRTKDKEDEEQQQQQQASLPQPSIHLEPNLLHMIKSGTYQGPIIRDFIDDIQKAYFDETDGVDFVPAQKIPSSTSKKKKNNSKNERVSRVNNYLNKHKINRRCLSNRKQNGNEIVKKINVPMPVCKPRLIKTSYVGIINDFNVKVKPINVDNNNTDNWEKETASILKGKNILCKFNISNNNKNEYKFNSRCLNVVNYNNINNNNNNNNTAHINKNFLTIGTGFPKKTIKILNDSSI